MFKAIYRSVMATLLLGILLCGAYPMIIYGIGNLLFHDKATGQILEINGKKIGSRLIGQNFTKPEYFHGRPSFAGQAGYDAANSSGSNLGPTNPKLRDALQKNVEAFKKENPGVKPGEIPTNAVTSSASGLDPHITPESALKQVNRIAEARKVNPEQIKSMLYKHIEKPQMGFLGEPVVNVLSLNLELDRMKHENVNL